MYTNGMRKHVSQREAYRLKKQVRELMDKLYWVKKAYYWPEGTLPFTHKIASVTIAERESGALVAARTLGYGISIHPYPSGEVAFFASKEPKA